MNLKSNINNGATYIIGSFPLFVMETDNPLSAEVSLLVGDKAENVFSGSYIPFGGVVEMDFKSVLLSLFNTAVPLMEYKTFDQPDFMKKIRFSFSDGNEILTYTVFVYNVNSSSWRSDRFLTFQPAVKDTTMDTPEFLTYVYSENYSTRTLICEVFFNGGSAKSLILYGWDGTRRAVTHNVNIKFLLGNDMEYVRNVVFYDIYGVDENGDRCTHKQRYLLREPKGTEQYYLFYNSCGGLDTLTTTGGCTETMGEEYETARISAGMAVIPADDRYVKYEQKTGYYTSDYKLFLKDFIMCERMKYRKEGGELIPVFLTGSDTSFDSKSNLVSSVFRFRKADDRISFDNSIINPDLITDAEWLPWQNGLIWQNEFSWDNETIWN